VVVKCFIPLGVGNVLNRAVAFVGDFFGREELDLRFPLIGNGQIAVFNF
jgi:hypothetical protein